MTTKQRADLETIMYFIPQCLKHVSISDADVERFFEYSEKGMHKDTVDRYALDGFNALVQGKVWRGRHMEMFEEGIMDGSMPYLVILGGHGHSEDINKHDLMPRSVVDFIKKELFKGNDADVIENTYHSLTCHG